MIFADLVDNFCTKDQNIFESFDCLKDKKIFHRQVIMANPIYIYNFVRRSGWLAENKREVVKLEVFMEEENLEQPPIANKLLGIIKVKDGKRLMKMIST